ncbi:Uncharacterized protein TCM_025270 [Theobroma cacao]|uniref:Uncharacterized protein n=1 Tax=Theobroma cacao TaxID=3641 RepID=A0A061EZ12_THECC|nr:Uncharacterized protein TCM_025270 [Theobroma cacao]
MIDLPLAFSNGNKQIVRCCVRVWINNSRRQTVAGKHLTASESTRDTLACCLLKTNKCQMVQQSPTSQGQQPVE